MKAENMNNTSHRRQQSYDSVDHYDQFPEWAILLGAFLRWCGLGPSWCGVDSSWCAVVACGCCYTSSWCNVVQEKVLVSIENNILALLSQDLEAFLSSVRLIQVMNKGEEATLMASKHHGFSYEGIERAFDERNKEGSRGLRRSGYTFVVEIFKVLFAKREYWHCQESKQKALQSTIRHWKNLWVDSALPIRRQIGFDVTQYIYILLTRTLYS